MAKRRRRMVRAAESAEIWDRWQKGEGLRLIGRVFGKTSSQIFAHLKPHGGIRPTPRRRSRRMLGMDEREEIGALRPAFRCGRLRRASIVRRRR